MLLSELNRPFYLNSLIFNCALRTNRLLIVLWLPHILTVIYVFNKRFYLKADTTFSLSFWGECVTANFSIFERLKIKRPPKWWMSQYVYNKHNTTWKVLCTAGHLRTRCFLFLYQILLVRCAHSFDFWYVNNSCVNTVRQHFPWSIFYFLFLSAEIRSNPLHPPGADAKPDVNGQCTGAPNGQF